MMVLDNCHASASMEIDGEKESFDSVSLKDFPGENISAIVTTALKSIKMMSTGYAMDIKISSSLLRKWTIHVHHISTEICTMN